LPQSNDLLHGVSPVEDLKRIRGELASRERDLTKGS